MSEVPSLLTGSGQKGEIRAEGIIITLKYRDLINKQTYMENSIVRINPGRLLRFLLILISVFIAAHIFLQVMSNLSGNYLFRMLAAWFDLDDERNLPTLFSTFLLLFCSVLLFLIAILDRKKNSTNKYYWGVLSFIFLFLSADETLSFHERLINPVTDLIGEGNVPGIFHFAWVIPALVVMVFFGLYFRRFYFSLNRATRINFMIAFLLYTGGALGMEMIGSQYSATHGEENFTYTLLTTVEESLELVGTAYFIYALTIYLADFFGDIEFKTERTVK